MAVNLTGAQIAQQLGLPESTLRFYRDKFPEWIPMIGEGRQRRYRPEAVDVFRIIADTLRKNGTATEVEEALARLYPRTAVTAAETQQQTAVAQQQPDMPILEAFQALRIAVETQTQQLNAVQEEIRQLRAQLDARDQAVVAQVRAALAPSATPHRSFWQRLFGPKSEAP